MLPPSELVSVVVMPDRLLDPVNPLIVERECVLHRVRKRQSLIEIDHQPHRILQPAPYGPNGSQVVLEIASTEPQLDGREPTRQQSLSLVGCCVRRHRGAHDFV